MFNREWGDMSQEIRSILEQLSEMESNLLEDQETCQRGEDIVGEMLGDNNYPGHSINVIPGGVLGECRRVLLVAIGSRLHEDVEKRILQAIEHIFAKCPDTEFVIFWAAKWDSAAWMQHAHSFDDVTVILKVFSAGPAQLTATVKTAKKKK